MNLDVLGDLRRNLRSAAQVGVKTIINDRGRYLIALVVVDAGHQNHRPNLVERKTVAAEHPPALLVYEVWAGGSEIRRCVCSQKNVHQSHRITYAVSALRSASERNAG
jgi:hypothetical protein